MSCCWWHHQKRMFLHRNVELGWYLVLPICFQKNLLVWANLASLGTRTSLFGNWLHWRSADLAKNCHLSCNFIQVRGSKVKLSEGNCKSNSHLRILTQFKSGTCYNDWPILTHLLPNLRRNQAGIELKSQLNNSTMYFCKVFLLWWFLHGAHFLHSIPEYMLFRFPKSLGS